MHKALARTELSAVVPGSFGYASIHKTAIAYEFGIETAVTRMIDILIEDAVHAGRDSRSFLIWMQDNLCRIHLATSLLLKKPCGFWMKIV